MYGMRNTTDYDTKVVTELVNAYCDLVKIYDKYLEIFVQTGIFPISAEKYCICAWSSGR